MNGRSDFKVKINRQAIAEITDRAVLNNYVPHEFLQECTELGDVQTANVLLAFKEYLSERKCEPDFELVLNE